jgi:tRNA threonylcarbamoyladenosine biosynthesis protein TsaE
MEYIIHSAEEMRQLGFETARSLLSEMSEQTLIVIVQQGDFGTGKTTFTQGLAKGLGINDQVTSPSYVYIQEYDFPDKRGNLVHVDAWRVKGAGDLMLTGLADYLVPGNVVVVEWGGEFLTEFLQKLSLPNLTVRNISIEDSGGDRKVEIT